MARLIIEDEGCETTIAEHLDANASDPETAAEIADALFSVVRAFAARASK